MIKIPLGLNIKFWEGYQDFHYTMLMNKVKILNYYYCCCPKCRKAFEVINKPYEIISINFETFHSVCAPRLVKKFNKMKMVYLLEK